MTSLPLPARVLRRLQTAFQTLRIDARTLQLALAVSRRPTDTKDAPVIFFNASTRIRGHSLNAAFSLLTSWALRLQGIPVVHFVCNRGMSLCLQGTDQDDVHAPMPCDLCLRQSFVNFAGSNRVNFGFHRDMELASRLQPLDIAGLMAYEHPFEDTVIPIGALVLPSVRWRLRRFTLP